MIDFVFGLLVSIFLSKDIFLAMIRENPSSISNNFLRPPYFSNHVGDFRDETADDRYLWNPTDLGIPKFSDGPGWTR